jgi:hypothetical protein
LAKRQERFILSTARQHERKKTVTNNTIPDVPVLVLADASSENLILSTNDK